MNMWHSHVAGRLLLWGCNDSELITLIPTIVQHGSTRRAVLSAVASQSGRCLCLVELAMLRVAPSRGGPPGVGAARLGGGKGERSGRAQLRFHAQVCVAADRGGVGGCPQRGSCVIHNCYYYYYYY